MSQAMLNNIFFHIDRYISIDFYYRQEALEAAISEKDAHLALLELSGIRTERQSNDVEQLRKDKHRLMERLKREVFFDS